MSENNSSTTTIVVTIITAIVGPIAVYYFTVYLPNNLKKTENNIQKSIGDTISKSRLPILLADTPKASNSLTVGKPSSILQTKSINHPPKKLVLSDERYSTIILNSESEISKFIDTINVSNLRKYVVEKWNYNDLCTLMWKLESGIPNFQSQNWTFSDLLNSPQKFQKYIHGNTQSKVHYIIDKIVDIYNNPDLYSSQIFGLKKEK
jgi:hypothetical protein